MHCVSDDERRKRCVDQAAEAHCAGTLVAIVEEEVLVVLVQLFRLEEVPATSRRPVVGAAAQNDVSAVLVLKLVRALPDVAHQIRHCEDGVVAVCRDPAVAVGTKPAVAVCREPAVAVGTP